MIFDRIELKDFEDKTVGKSSKVRKIKFKSLSFKNIFSAWNKFRMARTEKKLEKAMNDVTNMSIDGYDFDKKDAQNVSVAEKKILKKATAVARLESKIYFLKHRTDAPESFVTSRAIKIKNNMMKNMRYNSNNAYSVPADKKDLIFAQDELVKETKKETKAAIEKIVQERAVTPVVEEKSTTPEIVAPTKEEIRRTVDEMFIEEQKKYQQASSEEKFVTVEQPTDNGPVVSQEEIEDIIRPELDNIYVLPEENTSVGEIVETPIKSTDIADTIYEELAKVPVVKPDQRNGKLSSVAEELNGKDIADAIYEELGKVQVSKNEASRVNPFINEDGTYRMKREDIDDDFRITRIKYQEMTTKLEENRKRTEANQQKKDLMVQNQFLAMMQVISEQCKKAEQEKQAASGRKMPIVAPERTPAEEIKAMDRAVENTGSKSELEMMLARATELRNQQQQTKSREESLQAKAQSLIAEKAEAEVQLQELIASLEEDVTSRTERLDAKEAENNAMAAEIDSIKQVIGRR